MRGFGAIAVVLGWACIPAGQFECEQSAQCSRFGDGVCQPDGRCSYPDDTCPSGQRYSDFAGSAAGVCVPEDATDTGTTGSGTSSTTTEPGTGSTSTSTSADGSSSDSGPIPGSCDGIDCSGQGTCVVVDDQATCACEPGYYSVGQSCEEDPCGSTTCYFVDATEGDDANDGSREQPWQTIARLEAALAQATPGDHYLLRRGREWADQLDVRNVSGSLDAPVVVGAYGAFEDGAPALHPGAVRVYDAEHVVVRDLYVEDDAAMVGNRPCIMIEASTHVVVLHNTLTRCATRGIRVHDEAAYTVIADNVIIDVEPQTAIFVADVDWEPPASVGAHHWIIDNVVMGIPGIGIMVKSDDITADVKVAGNVVADVDGAGITIDSRGFVWAVANVVARAGDEAGASGGAMMFAAEGPVSGNVLMHSRYGLELRSTATAHHNTIVHEGSGGALVVSSNSQGATIGDHLVLARGGAPWVRMLGDDLADDVSAMDLDWFATDGEPCVLQTMGMDLDLPGFVAATGLEANATCAEVPGFGAVPTGVLPSEWDAAFWETLTPDPSWERCDAPAGARGCDGAALGREIEAIPDYFENDGLGWEGPLLVRQRYGADP
ncbi:right-handed parallel beta-helix repeat-containing protein [Paraliomyxa miuraensis]|uniref:right-handed parallel beta-helix repeat-containing protein n=1 Tax=Paraliomyxa miuraensis TaxID=376150 RepID=UPI00225AFDB0|nr:right-handed parallel beta-helix repeat-containing protein [Paraliomyxa miuraensis]MCX4241200.1 right-handed parallel beta-helix repeat-containing protein [Paraliomyxa miuraensis]